MAGDSRAKRERQCRFYYVCLKVCHSGLCFTVWDLRARSFGSRRGSVMTMTEATGV